MDPDTISVRDALDALRTFPRRFRAAVTSIAHDDTAAIGAATGVVARAVGVLEQAAATLPAALRGGVAPAAVPPVVLDTLDEGLRRVDDAVSALLETGGAVPWEAWSRSFGEPGRPARVVVQVAAAGGSDALRELGRLAPRRD